MSLKSKIKRIPKLYQLLLNILNSVGYFDKRFRYYFPKYKITEIWRKRTELVKLSPDNQKIEIAENAGKVFHDYQLMHNGLKITLGSYYDYGNTVLLQENKGVHEPQEEFAFQEVLKIILDGGSMLELGSFWSFYSMWFASRIKDAKCIMVEPDPHKLNFGKLNFKLNNLQGAFELGFIDQESNLSKPIPNYSVDDIFEKHKIKFLDILHSDIQGYELKMLKGSERALSQKKIGFVFISTHSNELHDQCKQALESYGYTILCSANLDESYSWDGLLVAQAGNYLYPLKIKISYRDDA